MLCCMVAQQGHVVPPAWPPSDKVLIFSACANKEFKRLFTGNSSGSSERDGIAQMHKY